MSISEMVTLAFLIVISALTIISTVNKIEKEIIASCNAPVIQHYRATSVIK